MQGFIQHGNIHQKYQFDGELGEGQYSTVCKITSFENGEEYAVKIVDKTNLTEEEAIALFGEIEILTQLSHPNVVQLLELYEDKHCFYMIFELMGGGSLSQRLNEEENGILSEEEAANTMIPIVDGLVYCHSRNVIHRDLKVQKLLTKA